MKKIGDVFTLIRNGASIKQKKGAKGLPITRIETIANKVIDREKMGYADIFEKDKYADYILENEDILMSHINSEKHLGKVAIYNKIENENIIHGMNLLLLRANKNILFPKYAKYYFDTVYFSNQITTIVKKSVNQASFTVTALKNLKIPCPPIEEQKKIANTLDKVTNLIELRKKQLEKLDIFSKALFVEMFGDPVKNPMKWKKDKLMNLGYLGRGISKHRPRNDPKLLGGKYPLIQTGDISKNDLFIDAFTDTYSEDGLKQSKLWNKNTLCITIAANIAKTSILAIEACFPDSIVGFIPEKKIDNIFLHYWFKFFQKILEEQAPESAQKNINLKILSNLNVIVPPIELQNKFVEKVKHIDKIKSDIQDSLNKLDTLKKSLMQEYFS